MPACTYPGCEVEVNGTRGSASRCPAHRGAAKPKPGADTAEGRVRELLAAAKAVDRARAKARDALETVRAADARYRAALRVLAESRLDGEVAE